MRGFPAAVPVTVDLFKPLKIILTFHYIVYLRGRVDTVARRLISCTTSLAGPDSIPEAGTVDHTVHPSGVGKLVAISRQLGDHCRILRSVDSEWT